MAFTAKDVQNLRERTGCGMMDCKKALTESNGDMDKAIEFLREKGLAAVAKKAGRIAAEGLVCGSGNYIRILAGIGMESCRNESRDVRHIYHQICAYLIGDLSEACEIYYSRIRACSCEDKLRLALERKLAYLVVVDGLCVVRYTVGNDIEVLTRDVYG